MALSKLDNLYRQVILDHSSRPHHYGELHGGETVDLNNPTCGDVIKLTMQVDKDRKSTRMNSSHQKNSYAVFCLKTKKDLTMPTTMNAARINPYQRSE